MAASFGKLYLWRGGGFLKEASPLTLPSESFTSGGFPKEANLFPSFGILPKEGRPSLPSASFGKLHLWRGGGFMKDASPLALPSESFTSGGVAAL